MFEARLFAALVEALGSTGEADRAMEIVEDMESRGVSECAGVYYALASALCTAGRLSEALIQVQTHRTFCLHCFAIQPQIWPFDDLDRVSILLTMTN